MVVVTQTRNYFKSVSENKEITKIISLLSTAINSTKKEVTTGTQGQGRAVGVTPLAQWRGSGPRGAQGGPQKERKTKNKKKGRKEKRKKKKRKKIRLTKMILRAKFGK